MRLIGELVGKYSGPGIVIGGGPSVPADLARLPADLDAGGISANVHGFKQQRFPVLFSVCADAAHSITGKRMDAVIREAGAGPGGLIISPCHFADYRMPDWKVNANTGLTAIAVVVALGFDPVIVTGIDCFGRTPKARDKRSLRNSEGTYFWDGNAKSNSNSKAPSNFWTQIQSIRQIVGSANVRPMSGPLLDHWPGYDPEENPPKVPLPRFAERWRETQTVIVEVTWRKGLSWELQKLEKGARLPMSREEAAPLIRGGRLRIVDQTKNAVL